MRLLLLAAAAVCFAVAVLVAIGAVTSDFNAWLAGGLLAYVVSVAAVERPVPPKR